MLRIGFVITAVTIACGSAHAALTTNALTTNALTTNALTTNALTTNALATGALFGDARVVGVELPKK
ncbi:MAG: hypothetical protein P4L98_20225 [Ancalomicrobiaceae bacterium]|nr:hypothetical protein [Ancalomicrobiaceae bacterium]